MQWSLLDSISLRLQSEIVWKKSQVVQNMNYQSKEILKIYKKNKTQMQWLRKNNMVKKLSA